MVLVSSPVLPSISTSQSFFLVEHNCNHFSTEGNAREIRNSISFAYWKPHTMELHLAKRDFRIGVIESHCDTTTSISTEKYPICGMILSLEWKTIQHFTPVTKTFFSRWSSRMLLRGKTGRAERQWALWISGGRLLPWTPHEKQKMHHKQCMEQNLIWRMRNEIILSPWRLLSPLNRYSALQEIWFQWKRVGKLTTILHIYADHTWASLPNLICINDQRPNLYYPIQSNASTLMQ